MGSAQADEQDDIEKSALYRCLRAAREEELADSRLIDGADPAVRLVRRLIRQKQKELQTGDAVPADTLAKALEIHRNTANKAISILADEGYLLRRKGRSARVVTDRPKMPERRTGMISHTAVALDAHIPMSTDTGRPKLCTLDDVEPGRREPVERHLDLEPGDELITLARVRKIKMDAMTWTPAIAGLVFMRAALLPEFVQRELMSGQVESLRDLLERSGFEVVNSEYRIRIAQLPKVFHERWAAAAGMRKVGDVQDLRFLRLESTTHCAEGPISFSIAYLLEGLYALSTTDFALRVEVRREGEPARVRADWHYARARPPGRKATPPRRRGDQSR